MHSGGGMDDVGDFWTQDAFSTVNDIIYGIYNDDLMDVYPNYCTRLEALIPFDGFFYSYFYYDSDRCRAFNFDASRSISPESIQEYVDKYWAMDYIRWFLDSCKPGVFRDTDIVSPEAFENSAFFKDWLAPLGFFYSAIAPVSNNDKTIVSLDLFRSKKSGNFSDSELCLLRNFNKHLCSRFVEEFPQGITEAHYRGLKESLKDAYSLTEREMEVADLLSAKKTRQEICEELFISANTLKKHIANIYRKLGVSSASQFDQAIARIDGTG